MYEQNCKTPCQGQKSFAWRFEYESFFRGESVLSAAAAIEDFVSTVCGWLQIKPETGVKTLVEDEKTAPCSMRDRVRLQFVGNQKSGTTAPS